MAQKTTLFSLLLASPWWVSALTGVVFFSIAQFFFGHLSAFIAPSIALPFAALTAFVGYKQLGTVSSSTAEARMGALREMPWDTFSGIVRRAYEKQGYSVTSASGRGFDFLLQKGGRKTVLQCRRWKVNQVGAGQIEELVDAIIKEDAYNGIVLSAGNFSDKARESARGKPVSLINGADLAAVVGNIPIQNKANQS